jgi:hypothetical protein
MKHSKTFYIRTKGNSEIFDKESQHVQEGATNKLSWVP